MHTYLVAHVLALRDAVSARLVRRHLALNVQVPQQQEVLHILHRHVQPHGTGARRGVGMYLQP